MAYQSVAAEALFEDNVVQHLKDTGWQQRDSAKYNKKLALIEEDLLAFLSDTQPETLEALGDRGIGLTSLASCIREKINEIGVVRAIRIGLEITPGISLYLAYTQPRLNSPNPSSKHEKNRFAVIQQLKYSTSNENAIDLGLFVNGIPVSTVELKSIGTQSREDAEYQYREDRKPKGEILLSPGQGALVHFALTQESASMTTKLEGKNTTFHPFNKYSEDGKERNPIEMRADGHNKYATAYMWEQIWKPENFIRILMNYCVQKQTGPIPRHDDPILFPRFHQWECTEKILQDCSGRGTGHRYLAQHSAGSGKSNTIGWTATQLNSLYTPSGDKLFTSVVVLTDRINLDNQTSDTLSIIDVSGHQVKHAKKTKHLVDLLIDKCPIIVSTIQKFGHISDHIQGGSNKESVRKLKQRTFAVIIDEAHSSQSGDYHQSFMKRLKANGNAANISLMAFTATPHEETLAIFGSPGAFGEKKPFHIYSMSQAIEEQYILRTWDNYFCVKGSSTLRVNGEDVLCEKRQADRLIKLALSEDLNVIEEKARIIGHHFHEHIAKLLQGKAKAMLVCSSRKAAFRYSEALKNFFRKNDMPHKALVAFSGTLKDEADADLSETQANGLPATADIANEFENDEYRILIVADKYQTGFDQPKLVAMYLDKKIESDIKAVQTLSRLNRTYPSKTEPFVMDFADNKEVVERAFKNYMGDTVLEPYMGTIELKKLHDKLFEYRVFSDAEVDRIFELSTSRKEDESRQQDLFACLRRIDDSIKTFPECTQLEIKSHLRRYVQQFQLASKVEPSIEYRLRRLYPLSKYFLAWLKNNKGTSSGGVIPPALDAKLSVVVSEFITLGDKEKFNVASKETAVMVVDSTSGALTKEEIQRQQISHLISSLNNLMAEGELLLLHNILNEIIDTLVRNKIVAERAANNGIDSFLSSRETVKLYRDALKAKGDGLQQGSEKEIVKRLRLHGELGERVQTATLRCVHMGATV